MLAALNEGKKLKTTKIPKNASVKKSQRPPVANYPLNAQIRTLKDLNAKGALAIFLGAGISASCGLPDWNQLQHYLRIVLNHAGVSVSDEEDVGDIARKIFGRKFNSIVSDALYNETLSISESVLSIVRSGVKKIVCFNFDDILEEALQADFIEHKVILNGERFNINDNGVFVFHPHGYLGRFESEIDFEKQKIILSKSDYNNLYDEHYCLTNLIQLSFLINHSILFVGLSLTDPNTWRLLKEARKLGVRHWHYALLKVPQDSSVIITERKRFQAVGVIPVWFNNFSDIPNIINSIRLPSVQ